MDYQKYIEENTIRCEAGHRGGGIEIGLTELFPYIEDAAMTAYQNYLGGGMLGQICNSYSFEIDEVKKRDQKKLKDITDQLSRYFHNLTNHKDDEWEAETFEENQIRKPVSAY